LEVIEPYHPHISININQVTKKSLTTRIQVNQWPIATGRHRAVSSKRQKRRTNKINGQQLCTVNEYFFLNHSVTHVKDEQHAETKSADNESKVCDIKTNKKNNNN